MKLTSKQGKKLSIEVTVVEGEPRILISSKDQDWVLTWKDEETLGLLLKSFVHHKYGCGISSWLGSA